MSQAVGFLPDTQPADQIIQLAVERPEVMHDAVREITGIILPHALTESVAALTWVIAGLSEEAVSQLLTRATR